MSLVANAKAKLLVASNLIMNLNLKFGNKQNANSVKGLSRDNPLIETPTEFSAQIL